MTEEEMLTKECRAGGMFTIAGTPGWATCSGSKCGHWQPTTKPETSQTESEGPGMPAEPLGSGWERTNLIVDGKHTIAFWGRPGPSTGRCGLAGAE